MARTGPLTLGSKSLGFSYTRTRQTDPTVPLGQFKDGAFHLASQSGVPLVALVLDKTDDIWKKGSLTLNFRPLRFSISQAMHPQGRSVNELKEEAIQIMHSMVQTLTRQN
jgi:1-acyl-sn-glycerol-3-phosphate acyltransferase